MLKKVIILSLSVIFLVFCVSAQAVVPAFPGAEGAGKYATGGRGGRLVEVTNLNDSGTGSLRAALDQNLNPPPKIIVFRVSGIIELQSALSVSSYGFSGHVGNVTIAGQTAPGDGITLKNRTLTIGADNVIVRHIRVRLGEGPVTAGGRTNQGEVDAISFSVGHDVILDHVSSSWSIDETMSFDQTADVNNVTFQWCMITEGLDKSIHKKGPHSKATLLYLGYGNRVSFHHNIYTHQGDRSPRIVGASGKNHITEPIGGFVDFRNNVVYNWGGSYAGHCPAADTVTHLNFVGNYYKEGESSTAPIAWEERSLYSQGYFRDNWMNDVNVSDPWSVVRFVGLTDANIAAYKQSSEIPIVPIPTDDALTAYNKVLADAGCSASYRDAVDRRIINDIENGTGQIIDCTEANDFNSWIAMAQGGTSNTITLATSNKHILDALNGYDIKILSGTGLGQLRTIVDYDNVTKIATVSPGWTTIPDTTSQYGIVIYCDKHAYGWPLLVSTTPPPDSDHDGMPDTWESARGLNPNNPSDGNSVAASEYTNVEDYLNYMAVRKTVLPADFDGDGDVDNDDLDLFTGEWLENNCDDVPRRNLDADCDVDFGDYAILADYWMEIY